MTPDQVRQIVLQVLKEKDSDNLYKMGKVTPHIHNGVDSPVLPGGGATPGGNNTDIQFNDNGALGGSDEFTFDTSNPTLAVVNIGATVNGQIQSSGGTLSVTAANDVQISGVGTGSGSTDGQVQISTTAVDVSNSATGQIHISSGEAFGTGNKSGALFLGTGNGSSSAKSGNITISVGTSAGSGKSGRIDISTPDSVSPGTTGDINIFPGGGHLPGNIFMFVNNADANVDGGAIDIEAGFTNQSSGNANGGDLTLGAGAGHGSGINGRIRIPRGVIFIADETAPTDTPSGGGYLYVVAGALKYKGSGGTVTPLAPA